MFCIYGYCFPVYAYISGELDRVRALKHVISPAVTAVATQAR